MTPIASLLFLIALCLPAGAQAVRLDAGEPKEPARGTVELPAGGLLFIPDERIGIEAQEVSLSLASLKAVYRVVNRSSEPVRRVVAWQAPEIDMNTIGDEPVRLAGGEGPNLAGLRVRVGDAEVAPDFEQRAWAFARDVTDLLRAGGLPLNPMARGIEEDLRALLPAQAEALEERGVVRRDGDRLLPAWSLRTTAHWRQMFEPGQRIALEVSYVPVTAAGSWGPESLASFRETYCIDAAHERAIADRLLRPGSLLTAYRLTYAVTHEPGWWQPIPSYRLLVEKPGSGAIVAACKLDLRAVGPALLEWTGREVKPGDDVRVLIID